MEFNTTIKKMAVLTLFSATLSACGGGSTGPKVDTTAPNTPSSTKISSANNGSITVTGLAEANSSVTVTFPDGTQSSATADSNGIINFSLTSNSSQPSGDITIISTDAEGNVSEPSIITSKAVSKSLYLATGVMPDLSFTPSLGINTEAPQGGVSTAGMPMPFVDIFRTARPFRESQRIPKTDMNGNILYDDESHIIFKQNTTTYDPNGWPTSIDPNKTQVSTTMLQGALNHSLPNGKYTVLYEGSGTLGFSISGSVIGVAKTPNENKYSLDINLQNFNLNNINDERVREQKISSTNQIYAFVKDISSNSYIKNIRIIMPGGTCTGNPFIRVDSSDTCPVGTTYESFEERLSNNRNVIIFNPDYLLFLRNFKTIRMMNLMEASSKKLCPTPIDCPLEVKSWDHRAKLNDAVWGGQDSVTPPKDHKGVPLKVITTLANVLNRDIWINIPHYVSDEYILNMAEMLNNDLNNNIKVHLEYSNEVWNSGFAGSTYMEQKGADLGLDTVPSNKQNYCATLTSTQREDNATCQGKYYAKLRYFSQRSVEVFNLWKQKFTDTNRLIRVLGSYIGSPSLTDLMLDHIPSGQQNIIASNIDTVAIAPYFYGCPYREEKYNFCTGNQKVLMEAATVDDVFEIIDQPALDPQDNTKYYDLKSLDGTILSVKKQLDILKKYNLQNNTNIKLVTYEGGQHLVPSVFGKYITDDNEKTRLRLLFDEANRDPRMKQRYETFLQAWKGLSDEGTTLFTLYTLPQSYYRFGNFGIKEHLNKTRAESPKFDGVMSFQETVGNCWWNESGCTP